MKKPITKEVLFMRGRGENCRCLDCPVLYGGDCPYDDAATNKQPRVTAKEYKIKP